MVQLNRFSSAILTPMVKIEINTPLELLAASIQLDKYWREARFIGKCINLSNVSEAELKHKSEYEITELICIGESEIRFVENNDTRKCVSQMSYCPASNDITPSFEITVLAPSDIFDMLLKNSHKRICINMSPEATSGDSLFIGGYGELYWDVSKSHYIVFNELNMTFIPS
jgi:hypothetical protein